MPSVTIHLNSVLNIDISGYVVDDDGHSISLYDAYYIDPYSGSYTFNSDFFTRVDAFTITVAPTLFSSIGTYTVYQEYFDG